MVTDLVGKAVRWRPGIVGEPEIRTGRVVAVYEGFAAGLTNARLLVQEDGTGCLYDVWARDAVAMLRRAWFLPYG